MTVTAEALKQEIERVKQLQQIFLSLPDGAGAFGAAFMTADLVMADIALDANDPEMMQEAYEALQKNES